jgi:hypothetical protein
MAEFGLQGEELKAFEALAGAMRGDCENRTWLVRYIRARKFDVKASLLAAGGPRACREAARPGAQAAEEQLRASLQWRKEMKVDGVLERGLPPQSDLIVKVGPGQGRRACAYSLTPARARATQLVPHLFHGEDKEGRPLHIERTGEINLPVLFNRVRLSLHGPSWCRRRAPQVSDANMLANHIFGQVSHPLRRIPQRPAFALRSDGR